MAETKFESIVFVFNYSKKIENFYMRDNDDDYREMINGTDLLVPEVGELVGFNKRLSFFYSICIIRTE